MVFSQTSLKTHSVLKVVDLDRLKANKEQQLNGATGVVIGGNTQAAQSLPMATTSFSQPASEECLKPEPSNDSTMFHDSDCEFFQDLVQWCSAPAKEELVQTIDSPKVTEGRAHNIDTLHTPFSPQGWEAIDANTSYAQAGFYSTTPVDLLSPNVESFVQFDKKVLSNSDQEQEQKDPFLDQFLDISSLPVVIGDVAPEVTDSYSWPVTEPVEWTHTHDTNYIITNTTLQTTMPLIDEEDSLDLKYVSVIPREVERNDIVISQYIFNEDRGKEASMQKNEEQTRGGGLSVDVAAHAPVNWFNDVISTPEVLSYVEQLEKEKYVRPSLKPKLQHPAEDSWGMTTNTSLKLDAPATVDYEPITPKSESHAESENDEVKSQSSKKRHCDSEDSDETYIPDTEILTPRKYKRRKPNVPIKDMILALEGSQQLTKARRGRPPKVRRESNVSSVCSLDDNSSVGGTHENKYRELRDKNNEASKRSRMNRKLKELQMEQLADDLEERNKKLKVKADILEDMTKKLKEALMTAILHK